MLPLVARCPALDKITVEYAVSQAEHFEGISNPPIAYRNSALIDRCADLVLYEELTWSHADKMSIVEYPIMSDSQSEVRRNKYTPHSDLQYGDRRYMGRRKTHFMDDNGAPQVRNSRIAEPQDATIDRTVENIDLQRALSSAGLTDKQRQAIDLVYFGSMTQEEAARTIGIRQHTLSKHVDKALSRLREYLTKD